MRVRGNNVSSVEVEAEVRAHPDVADVAAIGVSPPASDADAGTRAVVSEDEIKLVVMRKPGSALTERALLDFLIPRLPRFMTPRYIEFVEDMPRTPTGKIQKKVLRSATLVSRCVGSGGAGCRGAALTNRHVAKRSGASYKSVSTMQINHARITSGEFRFRRSVRTARWPARVYC